MSNGAAFYCVTALVDEGFVKLKNFGPKLKVTTFVNLRREVLTQAAWSVPGVSTVRRLKAEIDRLVMN